MKIFGFYFAYLLIAFCQDKESSNINFKDEITKEVYSVEYEHTIAEVAVDKKKDSVYIDISVFYNQNHEYYKAVIQNNKLLILTYSEKRDNQLIDTCSIIFKEFQPLLFTNDYQLTDTHSSSLIDTFFNMLMAFKNDYEIDYKRIFG